MTIAIPQSTSRANACATRTRFPLFLPIPTLGASPRVSIPGARCARLISFYPLQQAEYAPLITLRPASAEGVEERGEGDEPYTTLRRHGRADAVHRSPFLKGRRREGRAAERPSCFLTQLSAAAIATRRRSGTDRASGRRFGLPPSGPRLGSEVPPACARGLEPASHGLEKSRVPRSRVLERVSALAR